jgi:NAD(P)-dependent dehydrogenase (short-subunit alcohol dehydrogenase family)
MNIKDTVVLITSAAERVGRAMALAFAAKGANVSFSYYEDREPWQEAHGLIEAHGVKSLVTQADIGNTASICNLVDRTMNTFGRIDILINSASGPWVKTPFLELSEDLWDEVIRVNLKGTFLMSQKVAPHMLRQGGGVIISITDLSAFQTWPGFIHNAASKTGIVSLTKSMAVELAPTIRVNAIAPGTVLLPTNHTPEKKRWAEEKSCLKRVGDPSNVADMAIMLVENDFCTGAVYFVDGGRSLV